MSYESNITVAQHFFAGEDKALSYEVFASGSTTTMQNVSGFIMDWTLRRVISGTDPFRAQGAIVVSKTTVAAGGIAITGTYNSVRATNTQRVVVTIADTDTESLSGGRYVCSLKRMDAGLEAVLSHGIVEVLVATVR